MMATKMDRRTQRPYYRNTKERDFSALVAVSFIVGCMLGATLGMMI